MIRNFFITILDTVQINNVFARISTLLKNILADGTADASIISTGQLALARGGTHADLSVTGGAGQYLKQSAKGADIAVGTIPSSDINGTAANDNAAAGIVGEYVTSAVGSSSAVSLTTNTPANVTSISLTAGDWDVRALVGFKPAATTSYTLIEGSISTTSATIASEFNTAVFSTPAEVPVTVISMALPIVRTSTNTTVTVYLVAQSTFTVSTMGAFGIISARRVR